MLYNSVGHAARRRRLNRVVSSLPHWPGTRLPAFHSRYRPSAFQDRDVRTTSLSRDPLRYAVRFRSAHLGAHLLATCRHFPSMKVLPMDESKYYDIYAERHTLLWASSIPSDRDFPCRLHLRLLSFFFLAAHVRVGRKWSLLSATAHLRRSIPFRGQHSHNIDTLSSVLAPF